MKNGIQMADRHNDVVRKALADWLEEQDFTQKELARAIGCDPSTISGWKNDRNMKAADLLAIVEAVGVPPSVLLGLAESPYRGGFRDAVRAAARRVRDLADELEEAGEAMQGCGCLLTLLITVPFLVLLCAG